MKTQIEHKMKTETTYSEFDLKKGKCTCVDCIEEEKFIEETMNPKHATQRSPFGMWS